MIDLNDPKFNPFGYLKSFVRKNKRRGVFGDRDFSRFLKSDVQPWMKFLTDYCIVDGDVKENAELILQVWIETGLVIYITNCGYYQITTQTYQDILNFW